MNWYKIKTLQKRAKTLEINNKLIGSSDLRYANWSSVMAHWNAGDGTIVEQSLNTLHARKVTGNNLAYNDQCEQM